MAYSCCDFTDDILSALEVEVPEKYWDDPLAQRNLAIEAIAGLQREARVAGALRVLLNRVDYLGGVCARTEMVGNILPKEVLDLCRMVCRMATDTLPAPRSVTNPLLVPLKALLDWGREHTSPLDPNSPHALVGGRGNRRHASRGADMNPSFDALVAAARAWRAARENCRQASRNVDSNARYKALAAAERALSEAIDAFDRNEPEGTS